MDKTTLKVINFFADLILPLLIGYFLAHKTNVKKEKVDKLMPLILYFFYPIMGVLSFWILKFQIDLLFLPILGFITPLIAGGLGFLRSKNRFENPLDQGSFIISAMISNRGTIGSVAAFILIGEIGYIYSQLSLLLNLALLFMICYPVAGYFRQKCNGTEMEKVSIKSVLFSKSQIPLIGIIIGVILNISGIKRPDVLGDIFSIMIHVVAWMALLPIGMSIDFTEMKVYKKLAPEIMILKFLLTPLIAIFIAKIFISDELILKTMLIQFSTPTAINAVITTKLYNLNVHLTMMLFISTTALYIIVVFPLLMLII